MEQPTLSVWLPKRVYSPGETIRAKVVLNLPSYSTSTRGVTLFPVESLKLTFEGYEKASFQSFYFSQTEVLVGPREDVPSSKNETDMESGTYEYNVK